MIALWLIGFVTFLLFACVRAGMPLDFAAITFVVCMLVMGAPWIVGVIVDYRERKRINADNFLRAVVAAHQRANEARQATERA